MTGGPASAARLIALAVAALLLLAGCGEDDDGDDSTTTTTTATADSAGFVDDANALCATAEEQAVEIDPPGNPAQTADYASRSHKILVDLRGGLGELEPPADQSEAFDQYLSSLDDDASAMEALGAAAESGDQAQIQMIFNTQINEESGQLAAKLGLDSCAAASNAIAKTP